MNDKKVYQVVDESGHVLKSYSEKVTAELAAKTQNKISGKEKYRVKITTEKLMKELKDRK